KRPDDQEGHQPAAAPALARNAVSGSGRRRPYDARLERDQWRCRRRAPVLHSPMAAHANRLTMPRPPHNRSMRTIRLIPWIRRRQPAHLLGLRTETGMRPALLGPVVVAAATSSALPVRERVR